ncbi:MAG TPA: branched-chain amino acid ABC transporter substrate-binding protein [Herpetosiphonaceae bacterium]
MKRFASALMLLVLMASLLAACGQTTASPSATTGAASPAPESPMASASPAESPMASASPAASAAASPSTSETATAGAAAELPNVEGLDLGTIKIASQTPLSGPQSALGTGIRNGSELGVEQMSKKVGMEVQFVPFDDQATEDIGASNANQIAADQDILCVAGHLNSGVALAALPTYKNASLLMISPANTNVRITDDFGANPAYRVVGRDDVQPAVAAKHAFETLKVKNVYILHDKTAYGQGVADFFRQLAEKAGVQVLGFEGTDEKSVFDPVLNPILAAQPEAVFWGGIYSEGGPLLKQMREKGIEARFLGTDGLDSSELSRLAGEAAVGVNFITIAGPVGQYPAASQFAKDYEAKFSAATPSFAAQGYDAAALCVLAIAKAAEKANARPTRQQVLEAMKEIGPYDGVTGTVTFNEKGDRVPATYFVIEVKTGDPAQWDQANQIINKIDISPEGQ